MNDLLSRSELIEEIKSLSIVLNGKQIFSDDAKDTVLRIIKEQPTAYFVGKVVEELELHSFELGTDTLPVHYLRLNEAIEIVKQGGVSDESDNVCEWRQTSTARYKTSCGCKLVEFFDTKACYCKQCGKKIKVVEQMDFNNKQVTVTMVGNSKDTAVNLIHKVMNGKYDERNNKRDSKKTK